VATLRRFEAAPSDLSQLTGPLEGDLALVRNLISDRVFHEESFAELLISTGKNTGWEGLNLPDWLRNIAANSNGSTHSIPQEMARHLLSRGGKLFRATLILYSVQALSREESKGPKLAAAMELIHLATLVHDDVIDRADIRRGMASLPSLYDNAPTVLMGDHLFARAFELIAECESMGIISSSCRATSAMCRGEIEQLQWIGKEDIPEKIYFRLIERKTAALMASCTESSALLCGLPAKTQEWYEFGLTLGLLFQVTDDLLDFVADEAVLGKKTGSDAEEGKFTLPLILFRDRLGGPKALREFLEQAESPQAISHALDREGIFDLVMDRIKDLANRCHSQLDSLAEDADDLEAIGALHGMVDFLVSRNH
jgi:octaprenyl-diphosphate synthase